MTLLFLIFTPLCVIFAGEENCDFDWTQVKDRAYFEELYVFYEGPGDPSSVGAFTVVTENRKRVYFYDTDIETTRHEIDHIHCFLSRDTIAEIEQCNAIIDILDRIKKSFNAADPTPTPPLITEKMAYHKLMYSNQYVTLNRLSTGQ